MSNQPSGDLQDAYRQYILAGNIRNSKVACALVIVLMPAGVVLDYWVYHDVLWDFLQLRLICSALAACVLFGLTLKGLPEWAYRVLCRGWFVLPAFFISVMIATKEGASSPYYAGLNLVTLTVVAVIQSSVLESVLTVCSVLLLYLGACYFGPPISDGGRMFVNNLYFVVLTAVVVVTGNFFFNRLRFREFVLRHELDESRRELEQTNRKLVETDQIKNRFFANISHELRTPLTLLLAPLESLLREKGAGLDAQAREWIQTMHINGMRLLKLINDLLDLVRLESGKVEIKLEPVGVADFVRGLIQSAQKLAEDKHLNLHADVAEDVGVILTDRDKLEKVLLNLLFNSIKFTPPGGRITVRAVRESEMLLCQVIDTGMGIAENHLPHIFDRFWQADSSSRRKHTGTGIGLALVKELVQVQGGTVSAQSAEGKGTTLSVRLPCRALTAGSNPLASTETSAANELSFGQVDVQGSDSNAVTEQWTSDLYRRADLFPSIKVRSDDPVRFAGFKPSEQRPSILIADDEPDMLRYLKSQLAGAFQVLEASDGQQAIDMAAQYLPDLVLCDMMMPEKDGLQVCRELRERTSTRMIPFVLLTARADEETKLAGLSAGASDFLTKPFSGTELQVRLRNLVDSYQSQKRLARQKQILEATVEQLKETELQLVQSEKMASLGRLSAGIIHEINNPLNYVKTALFTLRQIGTDFSDKEKAEFDEVLRDIDEGINRVRNIVTDLRTFTHPTVGNCEPVELDRAVMLTLRFLSSEWKGKVTIDNQLQPNVTVWANQNRLIQVLINILQNAIDAMKNKTFHDETPTIRIVSRIETGKIMLSIRDNGEGIPAKLMGKIFDPFFSTKEVGQGMGLGLSICYRIMQEHEGRILAESQPGQYSEFTLEFPAKVQQSTS